MLDNQRQNEVIFKASINVIRTTIRGKIDELKRNYTAQDILANLEEETDQSSLKMESLIIDAQKIQEQIHVALKALDSDPNIRKCGRRKDILNIARALYNYFMYCTGEQMRESFDKQKTFALLVENGIEPVTYMTKQ